MQELLEKRHTLESDLRALEKQIYELETTYIEETQTTGLNPSKPFHNFFRQCYQGMGRILGQ